MIPILKPDYSNNSARELAPRLQAEVRCAKEGDIEALYKIITTVGLEAKYMSFIKAPPIDYVALTLRRNLSGNFPYVVALVQGEIAGWCQIIPDFERDLRSHVGYLTIGVKKESREQGLGRKLMTAALEQAGKCGLERIELGVTSTNSRAISLYQSLGFRIEGLKKNDTHFPGYYEDTCMMAILIDLKENKEELPNLAVESLTR